MPALTPAIIDTAFKLAGFAARPTIVPAGIIDAGFQDYERLIALFGDAQLNLLAEKSGLDLDAKGDFPKGFGYAFAATLLDAATQAGLTLQGRDINVTSFNISGVTTTYIQPDEYRLQARQTARNLRSAAREMGLPVATIVPNSGSAAVIPTGSITITELAEAVIARLLPAVIGNNGQVLSVTNSQPDWVDAATASVEDGSITLAKLADAVLARIAPALADNGGKFLAVKSDASAVELVDKPTGNGDIPRGSVSLDKLSAAVLARIAPSLTGNAGKFLAVNSGANAVELVDKPSGGGGGGEGTVETDDTLKGDGSEDTPLGVSIPFTDGIRNAFNELDARMDGIAVVNIANEAWRNVTDSSIVVGFNDNPRASNPESQNAAGARNRYVVDTTQGDIGNTSVPVLWIPHTADALQYRVTINNRIFPESTQHWASYDIGDDARLFHLSGYYLAANANLAIQEIDISNGQVLQGQRRDTTYTHRLPYGDLEPAVQKLLLPSLGAVGSAGKVAAVNKDRTAYELVPLPSPAAVGVPTVYTKIGTDTDLTYSPLRTYNTVATLPATAQKTGDVWLLQFEGNFHIFQGTNTVQARIGADNAARRTDTEVENLAPFHLARVYTTPTSPIDVHFQVALLAHSGSAVTFFQVDSWDAIAMKITSQALT